MQQSVTAIKKLSSNTEDYDPVTFLSKIDMTKIVNNMEKSVSDLAEEVRSDKTINSYTQVSLQLDSLSLSLCLSQSVSVSLVSMCPTVTP